MNLHLVGICGQAFAGKSTVGARLSAHLLQSGVRAYTLAFALPLKDIARSMGWNGKKDEKGRKLLQLLGTECMRQCIDPLGWIKLWLKDVKAFVRNCERTSNQPVVVIADDVRFPNELAAIRGRQGTMVYVHADHETRKKRAEKDGLFLPDGSHISENNLDLANVGISVNNNDGVDLGPSIMSIWNEVRNNWRTPGILEGE